MMVWWITRNLFSCILVPFKFCMHYITHTRNHRPLINVCHRAMNIHLYYKRYCTTTETGTNQAICTVIKRANKKKKKDVPLPSCTVPRSLAVHKVVTCWHNVHVEKRRKVATSYLRMCEKGNICCLWAKRFATELAAWPLTIYRHVSRKRAVVYHAPSHGMREWKGALLLFFFFFKCQVRGNRGACAVSNGWFVIFLQQSCLVLGSDQNCMCQLACGDKESHLLAPNLMQNAL